MFKGIDYLGDENDVGVRLADAATAIVADETEARDAGGADLAVEAGSVRNPFQRLSTNSATIIHLSLSKSIHPDAIQIHNPGF